jgi:hypothetical protein
MAKKLSYTPDIFREVVYLYDHNGLLNIEVQLEDIVETGM